MPEDIIDVITVNSAPPGFKQLPAPGADSTQTPPERNKGGRPKGAKTRFDAPSMIESRARKAIENTQKGEATPDTFIFGNQQTFAQDEQSDFVDGGTGETFSHIPEPEPGTGSTSDGPAVDPAVHRKTAEMIWDSIVMMLAMFIGPFWLPRKVGKDISKGEIPYDERDMVVTAFCKYLASLGMILLSPLQELWLAVAGYSMPRLFATVGVIKTWFKKPPKNVTPDKTEPAFKDSRMPGGETKPATAAPPVNNGTPATPPKPEQNPNAFIDKMDRHD